MSNQQLADELQKPISRKFLKRKVFSSFKDNIWGTDLADMQLVNKCNERIRFYYVSLIFLVNIHQLFI